MKVLLHRLIRLYTIRLWNDGAGALSLFQGILVAEQEFVLYLCNEFVNAIVEGRQPYMDAVRSANYTAAGICAQESADHGGAEVEIPDFAEEF